MKFEIEENCDRNLKFFYKEENGLVFNLFCKQNGSLLYKRGSDTLPIDKLVNYKISCLEEVEKMEKKWRIDNRNALIKKYGKLYPPFNKNGIFETYLIEIISDDKFVIYPVEWRNLDIAQ